MSDRSATALLFACALLVYAYFFQGYGFNQNAHFATVRALVERRTWEITPYVADPYADQFTGDVSFVGGRTYSSKPPGLALLAAPVYAAAYGLERAAGCDVNSPAWVRANLYLLTIWGAGIPAAVLVALLYCALRRQEVDRADALALAAAFAFGSLLLPYSGILMNHLLTAALLVGAWYLLTRPALRQADAWIAGALLAVAVLVDYLSAPLLAVMVGLSVTRGRRAVVAVLVMSAVGVGGLLLFHHVVLGSALATTHTYVNPYYRHENLFLGHFDWPQPVRLYWLSIHPLRGLFYCCPVFLLPVLATLVRPKDGWPRERIVPVLIIGYFLLFNLCYDAWTGGFGVGSRFLIPALPFAFLFAPPAWRRYSRLGGVLIATSIFVMLVVTAVRAQFPTNTFGPPIGDDPVGESIKRFTMGQLAKTSGSFNWGMRAGLPPRWSIVPPLLVMAAAFYFAWRQRRRASPAGSGG